MQIHKLGNDFTKSIKLNLLPGIKLAGGYWQTEITFVTTDKATTAYNSGTYNHGGLPTDFDVIVGQDVRDIQFRCYRHNSFPGNPNTYIRYSKRVDQILFLNLVYKLIGSTIKLK
jgi:hypothetical protein